MISHLATVFVLQALVRYQGFASIVANSISHIAVRDGQA